MQSIFFSPKIYYHVDRLVPYIEQFKKMQKVEHLERFLTVVPITMEIDLSNLCSHSCPFCTGHRLPNSKEEQLYVVSGDGVQMPAESARSYIKQMEKAGVKALTFTGGGDPTLHGGLTYLIDYAYSLGIKVGLTTHGGLLHNHDIDRLVSSCTWIRVSIDAANARQFKLTHGRDLTEWNQVWENISELVKCKKRLSKTNKENIVTLGLAFLSGPHTVHNLLNFTKLAREYGVDYAQIRPFHRYSNFDVTRLISEAQKRYNTDHFKVVGSLQKFSLIQNGKIKERNYRHCHFSHFYSVLCANEKMYICCHYRNVEKFCIGNLRRQSFSEVIRSKRRAEVIASINVEKCQELCRGDFVNRHVQSLIDEEIQLSPPIHESKHIDFL